MSVIKKLKAVESLYNKLDNEISRFQQKTEYSCFNNCHICCLKSNIEANPLEFLPLAYYLYKTNQAYAFVEKIENNVNQSLCILFNPFNADGACDFYKYRGLICRLFGFSAKINQYNVKTLITCKRIKDEKSEEFKTVERLIQNKINLPVANHYYLKLNTIDFKLSTKYLPINDAIKQAIEIILFHFSFRNKKAS